MKEILESIILNLVDDKETITKKIMGALTDTNKIKKDDPANPNVCMVYYYHKLVNSKENVETVCSECQRGSRGCVQCKKELIEAMNKFLEPIQERRNTYSDEKVKEILENGTNKALEKATSQLQKVKQAMKIDY